MALYVGTRNTVIKMVARSVVVFFVVFACARGSLPSDQKHWTGLAKEELEEALKVRWNLDTAKNVILFIGDGMGLNTVTATRIYKGGESNRLVFEKFPHMGLLKTYSANKMVPDSASTATALLCGVKTNHKTIGVDASVKQKDCKASLKPEARPKSLAGLALEAGKSAGFVTTMRVTHATPGPMYAHSADRNWESDSTMTTGSAKECKDHARQLVEDWPGRDLNVILGGGKQTLVYNVTSTPSDPVENKWGGIRLDGRNLIEKYKQDKQSRGLKYSVVQNNKELKDFDVDNTDYLLGVFSNEHMKYEHKRDKSAEGMPSISEMVSTAIKVLRRNPKGYFLMVEGGNIDMAHHRGKAKIAVNEAASLADAVQLAVNMTDEKDTLIVVTSDHAHTLVINGYPDRGSNIFGIAQKSPYDSMNYTTLAYGTGGPGSFQFYVNATNNTVARKDPGMVETDSFDYEQIAAIRVLENSHGGSDVGIYARGPHAHLFHNVHEQHYVYHAISYAAQIGAYSGACTAFNATNFLFSSIASLLLFILVR